MYEDRLYWQDAYLLVFTARVIQCVPEGDRWRVVLDRTAFYPGTGGQPCDLGSLGPARVLQVREEEGVVVHLTDRPLEVGSQLRGKVDAARRRDCRQQHLGQHLFSRALEVVCGAATVGFHLGDRHVTVDVDRDSLPWEEVLRAEELANEVVWQNLPVSTRWMSRDEAAGLSLRRDLPARDLVRVVEVAGFDRAACTGTHPARTGEVGLIKCLGTEGCRAGIRVRFVCGQRALRDYRWRAAALQQLARTLETRPEDAVELAIRKLQAAEETHRSRRELEDLAADLLAEQIQREAEEVAGCRLMVAKLPSVLAGSLVATARRASGNHRCLAVLATVPDRLRLVVCRGGDLAVDCRRLLQQLLEPLGGRGGGTEHLAQGAAPGDRVEIDTLLEQARQQAKDALSRASEGSAAAGP